MKRKIDGRMIAIMGLLIAMMVVLSQVLGFELQFIKITFTFVPELIMGLLFGPLWTGIGAAIADVIGMMLFPKAAFFIGFTINAFIGGVVYGLYFHKKEVTLMRAFLCTLTNTLLISLILTPLWLSMMYNVSLTSWAIWSPRLVKVAIMLPVETIMLYMVGAALPYRKWVKKFA
ncbi:hypothetical protein IGI37_000766 [Enterococcus sp. AZ194]|uniref:folate family ECF transporter S component n=1 Tax=Enterococcus sp. AZ194 TaxID=2774629 RepID=UPI003F2877D6